MPDSRTISLIPGISSPLLVARNSIEITAKILREVSTQWRFWESLSPHWKAIFFMNLKATKENKIFTHATSISISNITPRELKDEISSVTNEDIENILSLEKIAFRNINTPEFIEHSLKPLSFLKNLTSLYVVGNGQTDTAELSDLKELTNLTLIDNTISNLKHLSSLRSLRNLNLGKNKLKEIPPLQELTNLEVLQITDEDIQEITFLKGSVNIKELHLHRTRINNIDVLQNKSLLNILCLQEHHIEDISPLITLPNLRELTFRNYSNVDIAPISSLLKLEELKLSSHLVDPKILSGLTKLGELIITGRPISSKKVQELKEALPNCKVRMQCQVL